MTSEIETLLRHILESITNVEEYTNGVSREAFMKSRVTQDAVIRRLEVIGEATKNIPPAFRSQYPEVPWQDIAGLRDILIHHYFGVDLELTYDIVQKDLPGLKAKVEKILGAAAEVSS